MSKGFEDQKPSVSPLGGNVTAVQQVIVKSPVLVDGPQGRGCDVKSQHLVENLRVYPFHLHVRLPLPSRLPVGKRYCVITVITRKEADRMSGFKARDFSLTVMLSNDARSP